MRQKFKDCIASYFSIWLRARGVREMIPTTLAFLYLLKKIKIWNYKE
jgi:hypothetical protein